MTVALDQAATDAFYDATTILVPEDGDDLDAAQILTALQKFSNRVQYGRGAAWGTLAWTGTFAASGTAAAPVVLVGAIESCPLCDGLGVWRPYYTTGETTLGASNVEGGGSLSANAWYYVYAWSDSAAPTAVKFQITTTPPTASAAATIPRLWKRDQASNYRYLGCFATDSAGNPIPVRAARGRYVYRRSACASNETRVLNTSTAAGATNLSLAALVPPHARLATLSLIVTGGDGFCGLTIFTDGDTSDATLQARAEAGVTTSPVVGDVETSSAQVVDRVVTFGGTTGTAVAHVHGFHE